MLDLGKKISRYNVHMDLLLSVPEFEWAAVASIDYRRFIKFQTILDQSFLQFCKFSLIVSGSRESSKRTNNCSDSTLWLIELDCWITWLGQIIYRLEPA